MKLATVNPDIDFSNLMDLQPEDVRSIVSNLIRKIVPIIIYETFGGKHFRWFKFVAMYQVQFIHLRRPRHHCMPTNLHKATLSTVSRPTERIRTHRALHAFRISTCTASLASMDMKMFHLRYNSSRLHWLCFTKATTPGFQVGAFWEDDLQSVVQIGMGQGQEIVSSSQSFNGGRRNDKRTYPSKPWINSWLLTSNILF